MTKMTAEDPRTDQAEAALVESMHALSLEQALIDFEIANARVIDLTQRLVEANDETVELRQELELLRIEHQQLLQQHDAVMRSRTLRLAAAARSVVGALKR
jgi:TolA-binding protein